MQPANHTSGLATPQAQPAGSPFRRQAKLDLYVGLDFGTSSTKAAYLELGSGERRIRPLVFDHGLEEYPAYCLPSVGAFARDGRLVWGADALPLLRRHPWGSGLRRLKVVIAGSKDQRFHDSDASERFRNYLIEQGMSPDRYLPEHIGAAALALQMHAVRRLLQQQYAGRELDIRFNVCVPIDQVERSTVLATYHQMMHVAEQLYLEWLSDGWDGADLVDVAAAKFETANRLERSDGRIFAVPESVAQVASYLVSLEARPGIHSMVDVGAGTTDLAIFNLAGLSTADSRCYWYAAVNIPRGAALIENHVAEYLASTNGKRLNLSLQQVLAAIETAVPGDPIHKRSLAVLSEIHHNMNWTWAAAYNKYRANSAWQGRPLFLCGGGAKLPWVHEMFARSWVPNYPNHNVRPLPTPRNYEDLNGAVPFDRLAVAYGLAQPKPELAEYVLPKDSPDQTPEIRIRPYPQH